jgi:hypothetical protein
MRIMADPARRRATYDDVLAAPPHEVAEIIAGELIVSPRPAAPHAVAASALLGEIGPPFKRGRGGPGGWRTLGVFRDDARVRAEPFEAFELELAALWEGVQL